MAVDQQSRATTTGVLALPGARLAYEVTGVGAPVLLVHGFGLDMRMWDPQVEHLAGRFRVVRYDCRGAPVVLHRDASIGPHRDGRPRRDKQRRKPSMSRLEARDDYHT